MSHFTVMIFGDNAEDQLAPFQENNMGTCPEEYMEFIDQTDYLLCEWESESKETKEEYSNDFDRYVEEYHEYKKDEETGKYGYRDNPNKKWDYYQLGGRWAGFLKLKKGARGIAGRAGLFGTPASKGTADSALKRDIDFESMREDASKAAGKVYDEVTGIVGLTLHNMHGWKYVRENMFAGDIDAAREYYSKQDAVVKLREWNQENNHKYGWSTDLEDFQVTREQYCKSAADSACTTFAVIKDGVWYERGEMGWWGIVTDEKDQRNWDSEVAALLDELSDDTLISIYDCHI
jgi:hypothetical protein